MPFLDHFKRNFIGTWIALFRCRNKKLGLMMKISTIIVSALLATGITFAEEAIEKPERPEINKAKRYFY